MAGQRIQEPCIIIEVGFETRFSVIMHGEQRVSGPELLVDEREDFLPPVQPIIPLKRLPGAHPPSGEKCIP